MLKKALLSFAMVVAMVAGTSSVASANHSHRHGCAPSYNSGYAPHAGYYGAYRPSYGGYSSYRPSYGVGYGVGSGVGYGSPYSSYYGGPRGGYGYGGIGVYPSTPFYGVRGSGMSLYLGR